MAWYDLIYGMIWWYIMIWYDILWYDMIYDIIWHYMNWYGIYDMIYLTAIG